MYGEQSADVAKLFEALAKAQGEMANAPRTKKSHYGMYADLATVRDVTRGPLAKNGLCLIQVVVPYGSGGEMAVASTLGHTSGQWIRSCIPIKAGLSPQQLAANVTYARRIAYSAIVGIAADDDDDGETAEISHGQSNAAAAHSSSLEKRAEDKLKTSKTQAEKDKILDHVDMLVEQGDMSPDTAKRLRKEYGQKVKQKEAADVA